PGVHADGRSYCQASIHDAIGQYASGSLHPIAQGVFYRVVGRGNADAAEGDRGFLLRGGDADVDERAEGRGSKNVAPVIFHVTFDASSARRIDGWLIQSDLISAGHDETRPDYCHTALPVARGGVVRTDQPGALRD